MEAASPARGPGKGSPQELTYEELVALAKLFLSDPANRELEEELATGCLARITAFIKAYIYFKYIPEIVIDDAISLAQLNLARGLRTLHSPDKLKAWLIRLARNAAITEFLRIIIGRGEQERETIPLETKDAEGRTVQTLDLEEHREAAERGLPGTATLSAGAREGVEKQKILAQVLRIHMERAKKKRDRDSALWIQTVLDDDLAIEEIAKKRGTTRDDVWHLFRHDTSALHQIYRELSGNVP